MSNGSTLKFKLNICERKYRGLSPIHEEACTTGTNEQGQKKVVLGFEYIVLKLSTQQTLLLCDFDF